MKLKDKVALVTGGGSGIGRETCLTFAGEGASVAVNDISLDAIEGTIKEMGEQGARALGVQADVSDSGQVKDMFAKILERYGTIDILVNNAGIMDSGQQAVERLMRVAEAQMAEEASGGAIKTHLEMTQNLEDATWDRMLKVHLYGTFYCSREALKVMEAKNYGRIINTSSVAATMGLAGLPHYSAAKAGILGFTRSLAAEVGPRGITVNTILPGSIDTPQTAPYTPTIRRVWTVMAPLKRLGKPKDSAAAALYLASEDAGFVTGQIISPNGGVWMP